MVNCSFAQGIEALVDRELTILLSHGLVPESRPGAAPRETGKDLLDGPETFVFSTQLIGCHGQWT